MIRKPSQGGATRFKATLSVRHARIPEISHASLVLLEVHPLFSPLQLIQRWYQKSHSHFCVDRPTVGYETSLTGLLHGPSDDGFSSFPPPISLQAHYDMLWACNFLHLSNMAARLFQLLTGMIRWLSSSSLSMVSLLLIMNCWNVLSMIVCRLFRSVFSFQLHLFSSIDA